MVQAMASELKAVASQHPDPIETIYFGGGTPSLLPPEDLQRLINACRKYYDISSQAEITLEANPDDLSPETLKDFHSLGINRLSIGVQSFDNDVLKAMNRAHTSDQAAASLQMAIEAGFTNITADLIYGIPEKGIDYWKRQLQKMTSFDVRHISAYCLTFEPRTAFGKLKAAKKMSEPSEDVTAKEFEYLCESLATKGFEQYEISNFAKPGFISKHNSGYWFGKKYVGIGPSAHSYNHPERRWNIRNNNQYIRKMNANEDWFESEVLSQENIFNEYILTRLRTKWGIQMAELRAISEEMFRRIEPKIKFQLDLKALAETDDGFVLTKTGKFIADRIALELMVS